MKTPKKSDLLRENGELRHSLNLHEQYLAHAFRSEVTFIQKGGMRLGICGETRAHGGIVLESARAQDGKMFVVGVFYWESYYQSVRAYPARHDDKEAQDRRTCAEQVAKHVNAKQAAFYAPRVPMACQAGQVAKHVSQSTDDEARFAPTTDGTLADWEPMIP